MNFRPVYLKRLYHGIVGNVPEIRVLAEMLAVPFNWETSAGYKILLRTISLLQDNSFKQNLSANCKRRKDNGGMQFSTSIETIGVVRMAPLIILRPIFCITSNFLNNVLLIFM
ncbi:unnamed protein product [Parnassius mnemosyne]